MDFFLSVSKLLDKYLYSLIYLERKEKKNEHFGFFPMANVLVTYSSRKTKLSHTDSWAKEAQILLPKLSKILILSKTVVPPSPELTSRGSPGSQPTCYFHTACYSRSLSQKCWEQKLGPSACKVCTTDLRAFPVFYTRCGKMVYNSFLLCLQKALDPIPCIIS